MTGSDACFLFIENKSLIHRRVALIGRNIFEGP